MEGRVITAKMIAEFKEHLILEERSVATIQKYIRDVKAFMANAWRYGRAAADGKLLQEL